MIDRMLRPIVIRRAGEDTTPAWFQERVWARLLPHYRRDNMPSWIWACVIVTQVLFGVFDIGLPRWITIAIVIMELMLIAWDIGRTCGKMLNPGVRDYGILAEEARACLTGHERLMYLESRS